MTKRQYLNNMKKLCEQLNALIPINSEADRDKLNTLIADMCNSSSEYPHYGLYWDRDVYVKSGCNEEKCREAVLHGDFLQFEPNEDYIEHPGIVVRFKNYRVSPTENIS